MNPAAAPPGATLTVLTEVLKGLKTGYDSDPPEARRQAVKLVKAMAVHTDALTGWKDNLVDLIETVESAGNELADADSDELDDAHAAWVEAIDQLRDHLTAATHRPGAGV